MKKRRLLGLFSSCILSLFILSPNLLAGKERTIILATTTSVQDSGLLDELIPVFEKKTGYFVKTIAVGSGQALALGRRGEADILITHSPDEEKEFVASRYGVRRGVLMYNRFLLVGPGDDPAGIKGERSIRGGLKKIAEKRCFFLSRGDNSGTHVLEKRLWREIGIDPTKEKWYQETGQGMGLTLKMAFDKGAYTITDNGTYLVIKKGVKREVSALSDPKLLNTYSVIEVNPEFFKKINREGARSFSDFLFSKEIQNFIRIFGKEKYGSPLFIPGSKREGG